MKGMPLPLARALTIRPPQIGLPSSLEGGSYDFEDQAIDLYEDKKGRWHARVTGPLALQAYPTTGVKMFTRGGREEVKAAAEGWVSGLTPKEGEGEESEMDEEMEEGLRWIDAFSFSEPGGPGLQ